MTDRWPEIDEHIVNHRVLHALMTLRETFDYSIHQAIESFDARYHHLRTVRPEDFTVGPEEYGGNCYS